MTKAEIKRGLKKLDRVITLNGWSSLCNLYSAFKDHSPGGTMVILLELLAEYANRGDPIKRVRAENRAFQKSLKRRKFERVETTA